VTWAGKERLDDTIEWIRTEFLGPEVAEGVGGRKTTSA
jgi:hypothetical protein